MDSVATYPRFLRRVRALLIDWFITVFVIVTWWLSTPLVDGYSAATKIAYPFFAWLILDPVFVWRLGGTPGHLLMKLRIQDKINGQNIGLPRAIIRSLIKTVTGVWSFVFVFMTKKHQALHDVLASTTVVLRNPGSFPSRERIYERVLDVNTYRHPSALRRILVIFAYSVLATLFFGIFMGLLLPDKCLLSERCNSMENVILFVLSWIWFFGIVAILILGWKSRLYGARRKPLLATDENAAS